MLTTDPQLASRPIIWGAGPVKCSSDPLHYLSDAPFNRIFDHGKQTEIACAMLEAGALPDGSPTYAEMPLHGAASLGEPEVAAVLLDHGANIEAVAQYPGIPHGTPLDFAVHFGMVDVVDLLVSRGAKILSARMAAGASQLNKIAGDNCEFPIRDEERIDVFRCAVVCDRIEVVDHLLTHGGIDINAEVDEATALHWAAWEAKPRMVEVLLGRGADQTALDREHRATPQQWAEHRGSQLGPRWGHGEVVRLLRRVNTSSNEETHE